MNEDLINQIVRRILSDPALQNLLNSGLAGNGKPMAVIKNGLILLNYVPDFGRVLNSVKNRYGANYTLNVLPSDQVYMAKPILPEGMTWITTEDALTKREWDKIILPACSPNIIAKAALGIRDNPMSEIIGRGISEGKPLELVIEYLGLTAKTPQAYRELYEGYLQKLKTYGVRVYESLDQQEQTSITYEHKQSAPYVENASLRGEIYFEKKFLGDKQAYGFPEDSKIHVKQGTVISPLARDTLKLRRIEVCVEKEEGRL
ncbi:MAG TPA: flavoprotein [Desulfosporosinus sp.]|nr:flavoprotein [Desulfosporosinus sp.]